MPLILQHSSISCCFLVSLLSIWPFFFPNRISPGSALLSACQPLSWCFKGGHVRVLRAPSTFWASPLKAKHLSLEFRPLVTGSTAAGRGGPSDEPCPCGLVQKNMMVTDSPLLSALWSFRTKSRSKNGQSDHFSQCSSCVRLHIRLEVLLRKSPTHYI